MSETMTGVLVFHSETGTEGGYFAFQDEKFMSLPAPNLWRCPRCGFLWNKDENPEDPPKVSFTYWVDGNYFGFPEPHDDLPLAPPDEDPVESFNARWTKERNDAALPCYTEGHAEFEQQYPHGIWSYEGLHLLKNGDRLKVLAPDGDALWEGEVQLQEVDSFGPDGGTLGMRVHHKEAVGVGENVWAGWFMAGLRGELTPA